VAETGGGATNSKPSSRARTPYKIAEASQKQALTAGAGPTGLPLSFLRQGRLLADLRSAHEGFFPRLMGSELTPEF